MNTSSTVLIIGGTSGMGRAVADQVAARGDIAIIAGRDRSRAEAVAEAVGNAARGLAIDIGDAESVRAAAQEIGPIDHLVLSAAALVYAPFAELSIEDAQAVFDNKFWGYYRAVQAFGPMLPPTGSITLFSGVAVDRPAPGTIAVTAVNAAIEALTRSLAIELAPVRVNSVSPGVVETEGWSHLGDNAPSFFAQHGEALPAGRVGRPEDVASTVLHLIDNGYATASNVHVDGGARLV